MWSAVAATKCAWDGTNWDENESLQAWPFHCGRRGPRSSRLHHSFDASGRWRFQLPASSSLHPPSSIRPLPPSPFRSNIGSRLGEKRHQEGEIVFCWRWRIGKYGVHEAQLRRQTVPEAPYGDDTELRQRITVLPLVGTCGTLASNTSRRKNFVHHPKRVLRMSKNTWLRCTSTRRGSTMPREGSCAAFSSPQLAIVIRFDARGCSSQKSGSSSPHSRRSPLWKTRAPHTMWKTCKKSRGKLKKSSGTPSAVLSLAARSSSRFPQNCRERLFSSCIATKRSRRQNSTTSGVLLKRPSVCAVTHRKWAATVERGM